MSTSTRDEALRMAREIVDVLGPNVPRSVTDTGARWEWQHALELARSLASTLVAPVAPASAPVERNLPTERRVAAVELLLAQGYRWDNGKWVAPPAGAVEDARDHILAMKGWFDTLADLQGWTPSTAPAAFAARDAAEAYALATPAARQGGEAEYVCPACDKTGANPIRYSDTVRGQRVDDLEGYRCPHCGEDFVTFAQAKRNELKFAALSARPAAGDGEAKPLCWISERDRDDLVAGRWVPGTALWPYQATGAPVPVFTAPPAREGVPEGMVMVPREPTDAMCRAFGGELTGACGSFFEWESGGDEAYAAMLAAAPTAGEGSKDA